METTRTRRLTLRVERLSSGSSPSGTPGRVQGRIRVPVTTVARSTGTQASPAVSTAPQRTRLTASVVRTRVQYSPATTATRSTTASTTRPAARPSTTTARAARTTASTTRPASRQTPTTARAARTTAPTTRPASRQTTTTAGAARTGVDVSSRRTSTAAATAIPRAVIRPAATSGLSRNTVRAVVRAERTSVDSPSVERTSARSRPSPIGRTRLARPSDQSSVTPPGTGVPRHGVTEPGVLSPTFEFHPTPCLDVSTAVENTIYCPICLDNIKKMERRIIATACGHVFCDTCIIRMNPVPATRTAAWSIPCPSCMQTVLTKDLREIFI